MVLLCPIKSLHLIKSGVICGHMTNSNIYSRDCDTAATEESNQSSGLQSARSCKNLLHSLVSDSVHVSHVSLLSKLHLRTTLKDVASPTCNRCSLACGNKIFVGL